MMRYDHIQRILLRLAAATLAGGLVCGVAAAQSGSAQSGSAQSGSAQSGPAESAMFADRLVAAAMERTKKPVIYDPAYRSIAYPGGDVPDGRGVCSDVVVRSYRGLGIDLQQLVHQDMRRAFRAYPRRWGLRRPDTNIDHRRVPNLRVFFKRHGKALPISDDASAYKPGDVVSWDVAKPVSDGESPTGNAARSSTRQKFAQTPHIGIVSDRMSSDGRRPLIVHNIGWGTRLEDMLFKFRITGRYRYAPTDG